MTKPRQRVVDAEQQHQWPRWCGNSGGPRGITKPIGSGWLAHRHHPFKKFGMGRPPTLLLGVNPFMARSAARPCAVSLAKGVTSAIRGDVPVVRVLFVVELAAAAQDEAVPPR